jgi:hypothetical protein
VIGGLTAVPVWEFLKRVGPKPKWKGVKSALDSYWSWSVFSPVLTSAFDPVPL